MQNLKLFAFIFGVPLGGVLISEILAAHLETQPPKALLKAAARSGREVNSALQQRIYSSTVADVCAGGSGEKDLEDVCGTYRHIRWIRKASTAAMLLGLFMVAAPWAAGLTARSNRRVLLYLFKPGLYGTLVLTAVLIVLNAAILIASAYHLTEISRVSRPAELHRQPLVEPSVRLSPHSAPIRQTHRSSRYASERRDPHAP